MCRSPDGHGISCLESKLLSHPHPHPCWSPTLWHMCGYLLTPQDQWFYTGVILLPRDIWHVTVKEVDNNIVFLRKLVRGGTEHSFGIHVARMAGMPRSIVTRAEAILANLEKVYGSGEIVPSGAIKERGKKRAVAKSVLAAPRPLLCRYSTIAHAIEMPS